MASKPDSSDKKNKKPDIDVHPAVYRGLYLLWEALDYAEQLGRDRWDFAVELPCLQRAGMTNSDLRWLFHSNFVEHRREVTLPGESREFRRGGNLVTGKKTCFVLTESGATFARRLFTEQPASATPAIISSRAANEYSRNSEQGFASPGQNGTKKTEPIPTSPKWDRDRQELRWGSKLVKQFKLPSPNQQAILMAFEEESWPARIDDPLPPHPDMDAKRRLNDTIKSLNRHQKNACIHFKGDGSGCGVRWEPTQ